MIFGILEHYVLCFGGQKALSVIGQSPVTTRNLWWGHATNVPLDLHHHRDRIPNFSTFTYLKSGLHYYSILAVFWRRTGLLIFGAILGRWLDNKWIENKRRKDQLFHDYILSHREDFPLIGEFQVNPISIGLFGASWY